MRRLHLPFLAAVLAAFSMVAHSVAATFTNADWNGLQSPHGTNGRVMAMVRDASDNLYIGGEFTTAGGVTATYIAKWDGTSWSSLGTGMNRPVRALAIMNGELHAGGSFTNAGGSPISYIAKWNGNAWVAVGTNPPGVVNSLAASSTHLYAGGSFGVSRWDGTTWSGLGSGVSGSVEAVVIHGGDVYVGGTFAQAGGLPANYIARWNGSAWSPLGTGMDSTVNALASDNGILYAGGQFSTAGGITCRSIAQWNGSAWSAMGSGLGGPVRAIAAEGGRVIVGGIFTASGGNAVLNVAEWHAPSWAPLISGLGGVSSEVAAVSIYKTGICAAGSFSQSGTTPLNNIAGWAGAVNLPSSAGWQRLEIGINGTILALGTIGGEVYAGGDFTSIHGVKANRIARWNGFTWVPLGSGLNGTVKAIATSGTDVYAGGEFTTAGGIPAAYVAKWNGTTWSALGGGLLAGNNVGPCVNAIAINGLNVYVAGNFRAANAFSGVIVTNSIAHWNGVTWNAMGDGFTSNVNALAVNGNNVYAGGGFVTAYGAPGDFIAHWNGSSWGPIGGGMNGEVKALAYTNNRLFAGGSFTIAGINRAPRVAEWNGINWNAVGYLGINHTVSAMAVHGTNLYITGFFDNIADLSTPRIAKWTGSHWTTLGTGLTGAGGYALALSSGGTGLYTAGSFTRAGGKVIPGIALATIANPSPTTLQAWRMQHFGTYDNTGTAANDADHDQDGINNLTEWVLNMDPKVPGQSPAFFTYRPQSLLFVHPMNMHAFNMGVTCQLEYSDTLLPGSWQTQDITTYTYGITESTLTQGRIFPVGPGPRRFARLRITAPAE